MISSEIIIEDVQRALQEDIQGGDVTATLLPDTLAINAEIVTREPFFLAGQAWVNAVFAELDPEIGLEWLVDEGCWVANAGVICKLSGQARSILTGERTALNFLQTIAGTATQTYHYVQQLKGFGTRLLDTRKTLPGLRLAQKYAVQCAGGINHRLGLYDAYLIKENHIKACGSILSAVMTARQKNKNLFIEVEVENLDELEQAIEAQPHRIMLDNFKLPMIKEAVARCRDTSIELEVSGGVELNNIQTIAKTGVHYISVGAITKSIRAVDLSLLVR